MAAEKPEEIHQLVSDAFRTGDVDAYLALCEPDATLSPQPNQTVSGEAEIREALTPLLAMKPTMPVETTKVFEAGDTALICSDWVLTGTDRDGNEVKMEGRGTEVLRRQPDGSWRIAIDNPWGTA